MRYERRWELRKARAEYLLCAGTKIRAKLFSLSAHHHLESVFVMKQYFGFIDESGNSDQERFFGLGLLLVPEDIGAFYDSMKPYYDAIFTRAKLVKARKINELRQENSVQELAEIANSNKRFELKFKYINFSNNLLYKALIKRYLTFQNVQFCALIIDRQADDYHKPMEAWQAYIQRAAMLVTKNIKQIHPCQIFILADDLTQPKHKPSTFENLLKTKINAQLMNIGLSGSIATVLRLESHASLMLQIVDILLGTVMYDFKFQSHLIGPKLQQRQELVVDTIRKQLNVSTLAQNIIYKQPNYFSVWKYEI